MSNWKCDGLRTWMLGAAAAGLLCPSMPVFGQTTVSIFRKPVPKKNVPAQSIEPPKLLAIADGDASEPAIQPVSQIIADAGNKSEVQKQLEALYEKDGREMPSMNMNLQPLAPATTQAQPTTTAKPSTKPSPPPTPPSTQKPARPAQSYTQYQPRTQATPYPLQPAPPQMQPQPLNTPSQPPRNFGQAIEVQPTPMQQPRQHPIASFFKRVGGSNKPLTSQAPVPPDMNHSVPGVSPASGSIPAATPSTQMAIKYMAPSKYPVPQSPQSTSAIRSTPPVALPASGSVQFNTSISSIPAELPQVPLAVPSLSEQPLERNILTVQNPLPPLQDEPSTLLSGKGELQSLPELMSEASPPGAAAKSASEVDKGDPSAVTVDVAADFPNPFPEVNETEADKKIKSSSIGLPVAKDVGKPIVENAVEVPQETKNPAAEPKPELVAMPAEDPFAVGAKDFAEPSIDERVGPTIVPESPLEFTLPKKTAVPTTPALDKPLITAPVNTAPAVTTPEPNQDNSAVGPTTPEIDAPPIVAMPTNENAKPADELTPPARAPSFETGALMPPATSPEPHVEKMRKIRERFGMKGLKGFCPVTLHDERELIDARPEFHFTHRSQKFHFATAEARDKFEADPSRYAPAAYGADVVALSRDKDVIEGTLDFAAWFKGRLYLFGSQANYDLFIISPAKFATIVGNE